MSINKQAKWFFVGIYAMAFTLVAVGRATMIEALGCIFLVTGIYCIAMGYLLAVRRVEPGTLAGHSVLGQALNGVGCIAFGSAMLLQGELPPWASWSLSMSFAAMCIVACFLERRAIAR